MRAILSGQSGLALLGDDDAVWAVSVEEPEVRTPCNWRDATYLLADADDVVELPDVSQQAALDVLEQAWRRDRALRLMLILLDREEDEETRTMAAECVDDHFASERVREYVTNRLYVAPLPASAELGRANQLAGDTNAPRVVAFLAKLETDQAVIARTRRAWDEIDPDKFEADAGKARFEAVAVDAGTFRRLTEAVDTGNVQQVWMECLGDSQITKLPGHRNVITAWVNPLRASRKESETDGESRTRRPAKTDRNGGHKSHRRPKPQKEPTSHQQWIRVEKEIAAILADIDKGRETQALKFTQELVERQKSEDDEEFAVKTLCKFAKEMKDRNLHELQLQFAQWASDEFSWDAQAQVQLADAYFCLGRLDAALAQFEDTIEQFPNDEFACCGRAEVLRELDRLGAALAQFEDTIERFPNDAVACWGRAEVLRELGRLDAALAQFEETLVRFPTNRVALNAKANVLIAMKRYDEALSLLPENSPRSRQDWIDLHVRGMVHLRRGNYDTAIELFEQGVRDCRYSVSVPYFRNALAVAQLGQEKYADAVTTLGDQTGEVADVLRLHAESEQGHTEEARIAHQRLLSSQRPRVTDLRDDLAAAFLGDKPKVARTVEWHRSIFERECELVARQMAA